MALMNGAQYIESLRKLNTKVFLFGEEVKNWVDHPMIAFHRVPGDDL
jgi:4-hydroxybutyryl-CoA dehydratase/vinylacetyl-CoA-Delta-isomerase